MKDCTTILKARSIGSFASIIDELKRDEQGVTFLQILAFIASAGGKFNRALFSYYTYIRLPEAARQTINALALRINDDFLYTRPSEDTESKKTNSKDVQRYGGDRDNISTN